jgi:hypothetical protein
MARMLLFKRRKNKKTTNISIPDSALIRLVSQVITNESKDKSVEKGIWVWNRTDQRFSCSPQFNRLLNLSPWVIPDLDFWIDILKPIDLIKFAELMEDVLVNSKPGNFIFRASLPDGKEKMIQCLLEFMICPNHKNYVIGIFYEVAEPIYAYSKN